MRISPYASLRHTNVVDQVAQVLTVRVVRARGSGAGRDTDWSAARRRTSCSPIVTPITVPADVDLSRVQTGRLHFTADPTV